MSMLPKSSASLPEWVKANWGDNEGRLIEALSIAWDALNQCQTNCANHSGIPDNAMCKIKALGGPTCLE